MKIVLALLYSSVVLASTYLFVEWILLYFVLGWTILPVILMLNLKKNTKRISRIFIFCYFLGIFFGLGYEFF